MAKIERFSNIEIAAPEKYVFKGGRKNKRSSAKSVPTRTKKTDLTIRQKEFVAEYVKDFNGVRAAMRAGYSENGAGVNACRLLKMDKVIRLIEQHEKDLTTRFINTKERVLKEMSLIAFSDLQDYLTPDGRLAIRNLNELPPQITRAIKKVKFNKTFKVVGKKNEKQEIIDEHCEFELYDKKSALEAMGKELGMFIEKKEVTGKDGQPLVPQGSTKIVFDFGVDEEIE